MTVGVWTDHFVQHFVQLFIYHYYTHKQVILLTIDVEIVKLRSMM